MIVFDILNDFKEVTEEWKKQKSQYWILVNSEELNNLKQEFDIDEESVADCKESKQLPKLSFFKEYTFLVCNILKYENEEVLSKELDIFFSKNYIITVCQKSNISILQDLIGDIQTSKNCFVLKEKQRPCILLYYILDRIIVRNYDVISALEAEGDKIEINILRSAEHEQIEQLIHLRRQVYKIRKCLSPLRYIGDSLVANDNSIIEEENIEYFESLNNKMDKLMISVESLVQDLALVREAFESETANKATELMKVFTLIATVFLPLNLISSIYGMNFKNIPFVEIEFGYYYVMGFMVSISLLLICLFKKKKWL